MYKRDLYITVSARPAKSAPKKPDWTYLVDGVIFAAFKKIIAIFVSGKTDLTAQA
jgi:hypothetical protein